MLFLLSLINVMRNERRGLENMAVNISLPQKGRIHQFPKEDPVVHEGSGTCRTCMALKKTVTVYEECRLLRCYAVRIL
jgi:hypothetical protein